jgi:pyridoxine kinase
MENVLTIAGSDSLAGGGLQADLKAFEEFNTFGLSVITSIADIFPNDLQITTLSADIVERQLDSIFSQMRPSTIKTGLLGSLENLEVVVKYLQDFEGKIIVDPVLAFKEGSSENDAEYVQAVKEQLLPLATIVTPNVSEAEKLSGLEINKSTDLMEVAKTIQGFGCSNVLIKYGRENGNDFLLTENGSRLFEAHKLDSKTINGAGCTLSASIAALLAHGKSVEDAVQGAKSFVYDAIELGVLTGTNTGSVWQGATRYKGEQYE